MRSPLSVKDYLDYEKYERLHINLPIDIRKREVKETFDLLTENLMTS